MNMRRLAWIFCLLLIAGLIQAPLLMADDDMDREKDLARVRKKVEALRAWQLTEVLDLDEETSSRLFPAMREADQERWKIESSNRKLVREMNRELESRDPDQGKIDRILEKLQTNRRALNRVEERHLEKVRQILSPEDTARYIMFQIRFQREIKRKAAEALRDRRRSEDDWSRDRSDRFDDRGNGDSDHGGSDRRR